MASSLVSQDSASFCSLRPPLPGTRCERKREEYGSHGRTYRSTHRGTYSVKPASCHIPKVVVVFTTFTDGPMLLRPAAAVLRLELSHTGKLLGFIRIAENAAENAAAAHRGG